MDNNAIAIEYTMNLLRNVVWNAFVGRHSDTHATHMTKSPRPLQPFRVSQQHGGETIRRS
jgi:hypothetical protein